MARQPQRNAARGITIPSVGLEGLLGLPAAATVIVLFARANGSGRCGLRNNFVAERLRDSGLATLLFDLLTAEEGADCRNVSDIALLSQRLSV